MEMIDIGRRIKEIRKNFLKMSQAELAQNASISKSFLSYVEKGDKKPSFELLYALSSMYNINLRWIFFGEGKVFNDSENTLLEDRFPAVKKSPEIIEFLENIEAPVLYHAFMAWYLKIMSEIEPQVQKYFMNINKKEEVNGIFIE